jgi:hypothetical protein
MKSESLWRLIIAAEQICQVPYCRAVALGPDEIVESKEFPTAYGSVLRAPRSELEALAALRDKYNATVVVIDAPEKCFKYEQDELVDVPKDSIGALMLLPKEWRQKMEWPPVELVKLSNLHTLYVSGWDIGVLCTGRQEITQDGGNPEVFHDPDEAQARAKQLVGDADANLDTTVFIGPYKLLSRQKGKLDVLLRTDNIDFDCVVAEGNNPDLCLKGSLEEISEKLHKLYGPGWMRSPNGIMDLVLTSEKTVMKGAICYFSMRHLYFVNNNTSQISYVDGLTNLTNLVLSDNHISGGLRALVQLSHDCGSLKQIDLSGNPLDMSDNHGIIDPLYQLIHSHCVEISGVPENAIRPRGSTTDTTDLTAVNKIVEKHATVDYAIGCLEELLK